jgi:dihydrofolate reductase
MKLIVACDPKGGIGYQNKLPWSKIEGDLPRFKELTDGKIVVMGRNTWESLPVKPLPNRTNYIITSDPTVVPFYPAYKGVAYAATLRTLDHFNDNACIIGGAKLIESTWDRITEIHLTRTFTEYTCDSFIDLVKLENEFMCWQKENFADHSYEIWKRK